MKTKRFTLLTGLAFARTLTQAMQPLLSAAIVWLSAPAACLGLFMALPAQAASLQLVPNWGASGVPTNLSMYVYVPDNVAPNPPILVLLHYWDGGASGVFAEAQAGDIVAAADQFGFIMVVPQNPDC